MKTAIRLLVFLMVIGISGCKKDEEEPVGPLYIPQAVKDYCQFKPGTYWVYIDSVSGRVDSMYVFYLKTGYDTLKIYDTPRRPYEWFETAAHSEMDGYNYYFYCSTSYSYDTPSKFFQFLSKSKPGNDAGLTQLFQYKPYRGQFFYEGNSTMYVNDVYDSLNLSGNTYKKVMDISIDKSPVDVSKNIRKYIALNYGIVRKEYADSNQVWVLARSNIVQ